MTGEFLLDWAIMAISLFNTILALWLGLTILLSAERRAWGIWLASSGLLMGGLFFVSHSAILGHGPIYLSEGVELWWQLGWLPVIALPLAWYVLTLWYAGFWGDGGVHLPTFKRLCFVFTEPLTGDTPLHKRQRPWFVITVLLAVGLAGLLIFAKALPSYGQVVDLNLAAQPAIGGIPLLILLYPLYILLCIGLSLDVLRRPEPSPRVMGDLARRRARPWLVAVSIALLLASLLVAVFMASVALSAQYRSARSFAAITVNVAWFDLAIASLIGLAIVLLGQAIVSYELFTGKNLPRRGFFRYWRRAVILAAGYGIVVGGSLTLQLRPIYSLLLTVMIMVAFYALLVWRSFADRDRYIEHLRPFVASQRLYERLLSPTAPAELDVEPLFRALCEDVLEAKMAVLAALGPLAPLAGSALTYPKGKSNSLPPLTEVIAQFESPQTMCVPLDSTRHGGATWAVPLWSERGLIGILLLGEKRGGGLYTQEEIEIARASGERLIDTQASAEMARRLMALQRQRLAETQVIDRRARRVLHDDVLPRLHTTLLSLSSGKTNADGASEDDAVAALSDVHRRISDLLREMPTTAAPEVARLGLIGALQRIVEDELADAFDELTWQLEPEAERHLKTIPTLTAEVLFYAAREVIRNAAQHGRGNTTNPLHLSITVAWREGLEIVVEDNGVGLTTAGEPSNKGSGQGLALHSTMMSVVGGTLSVESMPGAYTRVLLRLPQETQS
jgi:signal transduction histidine kinase